MRARGTAAHAERPRVVAGCRGACTHGESGRRRTGVRRVTRPGSRRRASARGAPWPGERLTGGAGTEVREALVDHRRLGDDGDDARRAVAGGLRERVDLEALLEQDCPPARGLGRRQPWRGNDRRRPPPSPARHVGGWHNDHAVAAASQRTARVRLWQRSAFAGPSQARSQNGYTDTSPRPAAHGM